MWFQILLQRARPGGQPALLGISTLRVCFCSFLQMMQFAWQSYKRYAMGKNELRPLTRDGYEGNMFGELTSETPCPWGPSSISFLTFCLLSYVPVSPELGAPKSDFLQGCLGL